MGTLPEATDNSSLRFEIQSEKKNNLLQTKSVAERTMSENRYALSKSINGKIFLIKIWRLS